MAIGQCLRRNIILFFVCISCICVFSEESNVNNKKLSIDDEEYERRRKIVNSYLSDYYESKKDWVETYHHNYAPNTAKIIKQSEDIIERNGIDEIKDKFTDHYREEELLKYEMDLVETFTDYFKNDSNYGSEFNPETSDYQNIETLRNDAKEIVTESELSEPITTTILKTTPNTENFQPFHDVEIGQNIKAVISNIEVDDAKSDSSLPVETEEVLNELPSITKVQTPNDEIIQLVINGEKVEVKKTDYLQLIEAKNILNKLRGDLKEGQTFDYQNIKPIINDVEAKLTKNVSPPPVEANKIPNNSPTFEKIALDETIIKDKFSVDDERLKKQKLVNSYLSKFDSTDDWVETYVHNFQLKKTKDSSLHTLGSLPKTPDTGNEEELVKNIFDDKIFSKSHGVDSSRDQFYISRWLKMLLNKFIDAKYNPITLSLDTESIDNLKKLSENFDIVSVDEFFCNLISNSTVNNSKWFPHVPSYNPTILLVMIIVFVFYICILYLIFYMKCRPFYFFVFLFILVCFGLQAYKRYETSIAKKQVDASNVPPFYCESFVTEKSGLVDIIKDSFRNYWYYEDCKKYYEAVMVNPVGDINPPVVIMEILVDTVFQIFRSLAPLLNEFTKELLHNASLFQTLFIIFGFICFTLICIFAIMLHFKYKIRLPYFFATLEPTYAPVGSGVQDLSISRGLFSNVSSVCSQNDKTDPNKKDSGEILAEVEKGQIVNIDETISGKPIMCMNIYKNVCQCKEICSKKVAIISEPERQMSSSSQSPSKSDEICIHDLLNSCGEKLSKPSFHDDINNKLVRDKSREICSGEVVISGESKRRSSSSSKSPIKSCICHPASIIPGEKLSDHRFHTNVDTETTRSSDDLSMCSEVSHLLNIKPI